GLELKDVADNNIVTLVNSTLANNAEGNLANTGSNNSLNITNVAGAPNSTGTVRVAIANSSFETPAFPTIQESFDDYFLSVFDSPTKEIPGWQTYDPQDLLTGIPVPPQDFGTDAGTYNVAGFFLNGATDGANASYQVVLDGVGAGALGMTQTLPDELTAYTTYTLQVDVGNPQNTPEYPVDLTGFPGYRVELLAGNQVIAADNNSLSIAEGSFGTSTVTYTTTANDPFLGENLGIRLINLNQAPGIEVDFDRISFTANYLI
ncbi:MAG: hypothetical protein VKL59_25195, partial [Nostocaceae cyanobacterium]|nr:hypothetical protein [Nostocaceae cyanobacterium]